MGLYEVDRVLQGPDRVAGEGVHPFSLQRDVIALVCVQDDSLGGGVPGAVVGAIRLVDGDGHRLE